MQEVFSKIIEELEEKRRMYFLTIANTGDEKLDCAYEYVGDALDKAIEIVKQEAEKFGTDTNVGSNGWIPVSERMPDVCGYPVLLTVENAFGQRRVCKAFTNYMKEGELLFYTNEKEYCQQLTSSILSESWKPIAWMNLPTPYQTKGEIDG